MDEPRDELSLTKDFLEGADFIYRRMLSTGTDRTRPLLGKYLKPKVELLVLNIRLLESKRCDAYKEIYSPRTMELEVEINKKTFEVAQLDAEMRGRR